MTVLLERVGPVHPDDTATGLDDGPHRSNRRHEADGVHAWEVDALVQALGIRDDDRLTRLHQPDDASTLGGRSVACDGIRVVPGSKQSAAKLIGLGNSGMLAEQLLAPGRLDEPGQHGAESSHLGLQGQLHCVHVNRRLPNEYMKRQDDARIHSLAERHVIHTLAEQRLIIHGKPLLTLIKCNVVRRGRHEQALADADVVGQQTPSHLVRRPGHVMRLVEQSHIDCVTGHTGNQGWYAGIGGEYDLRTMFTQARLEHLRISRVSNGQFIRRNVVWLHVAAAHRDPPVELQPVGLIRLNQLAEQPDGGGTYQDQRRIPLLDGPHADETLAPPRAGGHQGSVVCFEVLGDGGKGDALGVGTRLHRCVK